MLNPYTIIIGAFIVAGTFASLWGWSIIRKARKTQAWPSATGVIVESLPYSQHDAHMPHITYEYTVDGQTYLNTLEIPAGTTPSEEFAKSYANKFPARTQVEIYYNPDNPKHATLEPGLANGDWLIFALGIGTILLGFGLLLFGDH